jgi:transcriptional regulator with XRE-family HTH domain
MDIRKLFGSNMRRLRTRAGMSQEAQAEKMGVDRAHVSSMERGQQNVTLTTLWQAANALGVKPAELLNEGPASMAEELNGKVPRKARTRPKG